MSILTYNGKRLIINNSLVTTDYKDTIGTNYESMGTQYSQPRISRLCYVDGSIWLAGTFNGALILRSTDDGSTWTSLGKLGNAGNVNVNLFLKTPDNSVFAFNSTEAGIYKSTDYGLTWNLNHASFGNNTYFSGCINSAGTIFVGCNSSHLIRSYDNGQSWVDGSSFGTETGTYGLCYLDNSIMLATTYPTGNLYRSIDDGSTWSFTTLLASAASLTNIVYCGNGVVLISGSSTGIFRSTDYGLTWTTTGNLYGLTRIYSIKYINNGVVIAGGGTATSTPGKIIKSKDYGATWQDILTIDASAVYTVESNGKRICMAGTGFGTTTGGLAKIYKSI